MTWILWQVNARLTAALVQTTPTLVDDIVIMPPLATLAFHQDADGSMCNRSFSATRRSRMDALLDPQRQQRSPWKHGMPRRERPQGRTSRKSGVQWLSSRFSKPDNRER